MKKVILFLIAVVVFISCNVENEKIYNANEPDIESRNLRTDILYFNDVTSLLSKAGYRTERIGDEIQNFLPYSCDTAALFVNYEKSEKYLIIGYDNKNEYLSPAHSDCDRTFSIKTEYDGKTIILVRCEGFGNTCRIEKAEDGGIIIVICNLSR